MVNEAEMRAKFKVIIGGLRKAHPLASNIEFKAICVKCYPFPEREYHPFKIWMSEVNKASFGYDKPTNNNKRPRLDAPGQTGMFE